jgi:hypothetical protein
MEVSVAEKEYKRPARPLNRRRGANHDTQARRRATAANARPQASDLP